MLQLALLLFFQILPRITPKSLTFELKRNKLLIEGEEVESPMTMSICLGSPDRQCFNVAYDTGGYLLWVQDTILHSPALNYFNSSQSHTFISSFRSILTEEEDHFIRGYECEDQVSFTSLDKHIDFFFSFLLADSYYLGNIKAEGNAGFARNYSLPLQFDLSLKPDSSRYSFINFLFAVNLIDKRIFYHRYHSDTLGTLVIGEELTLAPGERLYHCQCVNSDIRRLNDFWNCQMSAYIVNGIEVSTHNQFAIFSTGEETIIAPYLIGYTILEQYRAIIPSECHITSDSVYYELSCYHFNYTSMPSLSFKFGDYLLSVSSERLFQFKADRLLFQLKVSEEKEFWVIGDAALRTQDMLFDHESNIVSFISKEQRPKIYSLVNYFIVIMAICLGMLFFYALQLYCQCKKERKYCQAVNEAKQSFDLANLSYSRNY